MRTALALALVAFTALPAAAQTCAELGTAIHTLDAAFPRITAGTEQELATWRASCAEAPPTGEGNVLLLCQADTDETPVFYWVKQAKNHQTLGYASCP